MKLPWLTENQKFAIGATTVFLGFVLYFAAMKSADAGEPVRVTIHNGIAVAEYNEPCPGGTEGCYDEIRHALYYPVPEDLVHEREHADGMRHGPWAKMGGDWPWMCASITASGDTHWRVGEYICRTPRGEYVSGGS